MSDRSKNPRLSRRAVVLGAAVTLLPALTGCGLVSFDVSQDVPPQTIMGSPLGALVPATLFSLPLNIDLSAETTARGTGPAKSANLSSLTLSISSPTGGTFDFLTSITFSVASPNDPSLPEVVIAKLQPVPGDAVISIPPAPGVDLLPYIKAGASIKASASGHQPTQDTVITGKVVVAVHV
jgi:hypothetical protein